MNSAAAFIDAVNARAAGSGRLREAARSSWLGWIDRVAHRPAAPTGAPVRELVGVLAARPLAMPPGRSPGLSRWQAFSTLWRQEWQPASRDERPWRWTAGGVSFFWHIVLAVVLVWVTALQFLQPPTAEDEAVQVEYIGTGTPEAEGGGEPSGAVSSDAPAEAARSSSTPPPVSAPSPQLPTVTTPPPDVVAPVPDVATRDVPEPATAAQPLTVTTPVTAEPPEFVLPATTAAAPVAAPDIARVPPVRVVEVPEPVRAPAASITSPTLAVEPIRAPSPAVAQREVPAPVRLPTVAAPSARVDSRALTPSVPQVATREIPVPATAPPGAASPSSAARTAAPTSAAPGTSASPASASARNVGAGPRPAPAPGSWATPRRGDDRGESDRNVAGRDGGGLFDGDGRPRLGEPPGSASPGRPPGSVTQEIANLDRSGTWLKRRPTDYEPTAFDRYWRPNETLLQEWVRRGFKEVAIPIPGTSKRIVCGISILQLGGGCAVSDPNLNDQPAGARPPPDIPFKPHLQEGAGATIPPEPPVEPGEG